MRYLIRIVTLCCACQFFSPSSGAEESTTPLPANRLSVVDIALTTVGRAEDITISDDGKRAWACMGLGKTLVLKIDPVTGQSVERFGDRVSTPQNILQRRDTLYVVANSHLRPRPRLLIYKTAPKTVRRDEIPLDDRRLYRTSSACLTGDGSSLWLTSWPNTSSLYGRVDPALFRVDLKTREMLRILGPPPDKMATNMEQRPPLSVCFDEENGVLVADPSASAIRFFPKGQAKQAEPMKLEFEPGLIPRRIKRYLPICGNKKGVIVDTKSRKVVARFDLPGKATAVCVDSSGTTAFVATAGSNDVLAIDAVTGTLRGRLDLSRPGGTPEADVRHGKNVHDIVALRWAEKPNRLLALGYSGYIVIVATLGEKP